MEKLRYKIKINSPVEKVWKTMLADESYRIWTAEFAEGSHYVGEWAKGGKILFLGPDKEGNMGGMVSRIKEYDLYKFISIEHLGFMKDGKEDTTSDEVKAWSGALENYSFEAIDNDITELSIEMDSDENMTEMFNETWIKALKKLKEICEQ